MENNSVEEKQGFFESFNLDDFESLAIGTHKQKLEYSKRLNTVNMFLKAIKEFINVSMKPKLDQENLDTNQVNFCDI